MISLSSKSWRSIFEKNIDDHSEILRKEQGIPAYRIIFENYVIHPTRLQHNSALTCHTFTIKSTCTRFEKSVDVKFYYKHMH